MPITTPLSRRVIGTAALAALASSGAMAADAYLKLGDIKGEAAATGQGAPWIALDSWSWGEARETGTGLATGKRQHQPIHITKPIDKASPKLGERALASPSPSGSMSFRGVVMGCGAGNRYPVAHLQTATADYHFRDVVITSCGLGGSGGSGGDRPMEEISFNYAKVTTTIRPADKVRVRGWDPEKKEE